MTASPTRLADTNDQIEPLEGSRANSLQEKDVKRDPAEGTTQAKPAVDVPPNGGWGWVNVTCVSLINAHTWGLNSSYGVFLAYYLSNSVFPGATRLDFAFVGGLSISVALFICPLGTMITRHFGTKATLFTGVFFETISLIGASFAKEIWQLFLSQGVCFGFGMGFLFSGNVGIIPQWFTTRRSLANGIGSAGSGLGGLVYSLAANAMIQRIGLSWAFRILGIVACIVNTVCALLIRDRHKQVGTVHAAADVRLLRRPEYIFLLIFGFLSMLGYIALLFSLPNYADSIGLTAAQGSVLGAVLNLGQGLGRPPIGYFSDSFGRLNMGATMTFLSGLFALVIWINAVSYGVIIFYALVGGMVAGTYWAVIAPITAEVVGLRDLASGLSLNWLVLALPTTFSEAIALQITAENGGKYLGAQLFCGIMYIAGAASLWCVRAWKIEQLAEAAAAKEGEGSTDNAAEEVQSSRSVARSSKWRRYLRNMFKWQKV